MSIAAYSGTPLAKKLGLKKETVIRLYNEPAYYYSLFTDWPQDITISNSKKEKKDLIHFFTSSAEELYRYLPGLKEEIRPKGTIWISWPKKASKRQRDLTEDVIRQMALAIELVDVKVCAVDSVWSGLKLVIPVKDRSIEKK